MGHETYLSDGDVISVPLVVVHCGLARASAELTVWLRADTHVALAAPACRAVAGK